MDKLQYKMDRINAGLTQQAMADKFGIPKRNIENWEGGKAEPPTWAYALLKEKLDKLREYNDENGVIIRSRTLK